MPAKLASGLGSHGEPVYDQVMAQLSDFSIYTMRHSKTLGSQCEKRGQHILTERKRWVSGDKLFDYAMAAGHRMPLLLSGAEADTGVIFWALIDELAVNGVTNCRYSELRRVEPARPLSSLILKSTGKAMSDDYIRPYAICRTPDWLR